MFKLSVSPEDAPDRAEYVELDFEKGDCVAVNGRRLTPAGVLEALNKLAASTASDASTWSRTASSA